MSNTGLEILARYGLIRSDLRRNWQRQTRNEINPVTIAEKKIQDSQAGDRKINFWTGVFILQTLIILPSSHPLGPIPKLSLVLLIVSVVFGGLAIYRSLSRKETSTFGTTYESLATVLEMDLVALTKTELPKLKELARGILNREHTKTQHAPNGPMAQAFAEYSHTELFNTFELLESEDDENWST